MKLSAALAIFSLLVAGVWSGQMEFPEPPTVKHICNYEHTKVYDNDLNPYFKLKNLPGVECPDGSIHLEFYAFAKRDLHIMFSDKKYVKVGEPCIQIVVGAENGTANEIRNQRSGYPIFYEYDPSVLNKMLVNRVNIWIRDCGQIRVEVNHHQFKYKMDLMQMKYVSFASWNQSPLHVFFNCTTQIPPKNFTLSDLINESFHPNRNGNPDMTNIVRN